MSDLPPLAAQTLAQDTYLNPRPTVGPASFDRASRLYPQPHEHGIDDDDDDRASISSSILDFDYVRPPRRPLPPLPDLRFEQSYLASLAPADGVWWKIVLITLKDQVMLPLLQGVGFNLALFGWRHWNRGVKFHGMGLGAKVRRWWWGVNNWKLPERA
ncbi:hypothetical protein BZA77DRAFT_302851 [Pyronema omphalodes]|nr:hypothetical protein BZA77DRAFT_302851 [Pyronema omphalodes]